MDDTFLCKAKRVDNGDWVEGYYVKHIDTCVCFPEDLKPENVHHWIVFDGFCDWGSEPPLKRVDIDPATLCSAYEHQEENGSDR